MKPAIWKLNITTHVVTDGPNDDPNLWGVEAIGEVLDNKPMALGLTWSATRLVAMDEEEEEPKARRYTCGRCGRNGHAAVKCPNV